MSRSNTSKNNAHKSSKPDKTKGLESHICDMGKSECCVKVTDCIMSHIRQEHDQGNDIATATEKGEEKNFASLMPTARTTSKPDELGDIERSARGTKCPSLTKPASRNFD